MSYILQDATKRLCEAIAKNSELLQLFCSSVAAVSCPVAAQARSTSLSLTHTHIHRRVCVMGSFKWWAYSVPSAICVSLLSLTPLFLPSFDFYALKSLFQKRKVE